MAIHVLEQRSGPVCGVFAVAMACGQAFDAVFDLARQLTGRAVQWRGRMTFRAVQRVLHATGVEFKPCEGFAGMTVQRAANQLPADQHYIIYVTGHFFTLHQGKVFDQRHATGSPVADNRWRRYRIRGIVKVL